MYKTPWCVHVVPVVSTSPAFLRIIMTPAPLILSLLFSLSLCVRLRGAGEDAAQGPCVSGQGCSLRCTAVRKAGVQYMAVRWYKLSTLPAPQQKGLVTRNLPNGTTMWYIDVDTKVDFQGESLDVFLPNVTCRDSGVYKCHLAAPVGEQNREGNIVLTLTDCPVEPKYISADPREPLPHAAENLLTDAKLVFAAAVLMVALLIFLISYSCSKNTFREKAKTTKKEILLNAPLKPLEKKDLMLIYTLGPKSSMKHICV